MELCPEGDEVLASPESASPLLASRGDLRSVRSCAGLFTLRAKFGGTDRHRTGNLLLARQVLSQLSYGPVGGSRGSCTLTCRMRTGRSPVDPMDPK